MEPAALNRPPPLTFAVLPLMVLLTIVAMPPATFAMPPPLSPLTRLFAKSVLKLPLTTIEVAFSVPWLRIPPPGVLVLPPLIVTPEIVSAAFGSTSITRSRVLDPVFGKFATILVLDAPAPAMLIVLPNTSRSPFLPSLFPPPGVVNV